MTFNHEVKSTERQELEEKINKLVSSLSDYYSVKVEEYSNQINILIIKVYRKYYEISEFCGENTQDEEEFNQCLIEELNEINQESSINFELKYADDSISVEAYPMYCLGDYCEVGLEIEVKTLDKPDYQTLYPIIEEILKLTFNLIYYNTEVTGKNINEILESS